MRKVFSIGLKTNLVKSKMVLDFFFTHQQLSSSVHSAAIVARSYITAIQNCSLFYISFRLPNFKILLTI